MKEFTILLFAMSAALAESEKPMQMFVFAYPPSIPTGASVSISGSVPLDGNGTGRIVVTPPDQRPITVNANWDGTGNYTVDFKETKWAGTYKIEVYSPGGKGYGTQSFSAKPAKEMSAEVQSGEDQTIKLVQTDIKDADDAITEIPPSPATQDARAKLKTLADRLEQFRAHALVENALESVLKPVQNTPDLGSAGVLKSVSAWKAQAKMKLADIEREMAQIRKKTEQCEKLDKLNQSMALLPTLIDIAAGPFKIISAQYPSNSSSSASLAWITESGRLAAQTANSISGAGFAKYCEKFQGPFTGILHAEFSKTRGPWWKYDEQISGTLTLRYAKGAAGRYMKVLGEFKGKIDKFDCWEDALPVLYPDLMSDSRATIAYKKITLPEPVPFSVPVEGELTGTKLSLRVFDATSDAPKDLAAHVVDVVVSPMLMAPKLVAFVLPFKDAHSVLARATNEQSLDLQVEIDQLHNVSTIFKDFQRNMTPEGARAIYSLTVKVCNPNCQ